MHRRSAALSIIHIFSSTWATIMTPSALIARPFLFMIVICVETASRPNARSPLRARGSLLAPRFLVMISALEMRVLFRRRPREGVGK